MEVIKINKQNFNEEVLNSKTPVIIDFYADWCGPCKMMAPIIEEIATELEGKAKVGKLNVDENQDLAIDYEVMSIPTIAIFKEGKAVKTFVGVTDKQDIIEGI